MALYVPLTSSESLSLGATLDPSESAALSDLMMVVFQGRKYSEIDLRKLVLAPRIVFLVLPAESVGSKHMQRWERLQKTLAEIAVCAPYQYLPSSIDGCY